MTTLLRLKTETKIVVWSRYFSDGHERATFFGWFNGGKSSAFYVVFFGLVNCKIKRLSLFFFYLSICFTYSMI